MLLISLLSFCFVCRGAGFFGLYTQNTAIPVKSERQVKNKGFRVEIKKFSSSEKSMGVILEKTSILLFYIVYIIECGVIFSVFDLLSLDFRAKDYSAQAFVFLLDSEIKRLPYQQGFEERIPASGEKSMDLKGSDFFMGPMSN